MFKVNKRNNRKKIERDKYKDKDTQLTFTCSKSTVETPDKGVKRIRRYQYPANICLFKVNDINHRKKCGISSKRTVQTPERCQCRRSDVFVVNFKHIFTPFSRVSIVDFEQINDT